MNNLYKYIGGLLLLLSAQSFAQESPAFDLQLLKIQQQWATINYSLQGEEQEIQFQLLIIKAQQFSVAYPGRAEAWIWLGISQSSYAGAKGGLGALSLAKEAKKSLERALKLNDAALAGSAYTSLGTLYHKVPGWPLGFGDDQQAKILLEKALRINPNGIDPNYFYGAFLYDEGDYKQAQKVLLQAQKAPPRDNRPLADEARQKEVAQLLAQVDKKIK